MKRDYGLTILDIGERFFAINRKRNGAKSLRATFFDFVPRTVEESDKVENYRFLENCTIEIAENRLFSTLHVHIGKIVKKIDFFKF